MKRHLDAMFENIGVRANPETPAIERDAILPYSAFDDIVLSCEKSFDDANIPLTSVIGLTSTSIAWPALLTGIIRSRRVFLPMSPLLDKLEFVRPSLEYVRPRWVVADEDDFLALSSALAVRVSIVSTVASPHCSTTRLAHLEYPGRESPVLLGDDVCYLIPTSGSTGQPKFVMGSRMGLEHFVSWEIDSLALSVGTRGSQLTPITFDPVLRDVFVPLCTDGTVCIPPSSDVLRDPGGLVKWICEARIDLIHCIPTLFRALMREVPSAKDFESVKHILLAGEQLYCVDVQRWHSLVGRRVTLRNLYGPTETTLAKFCHEISERDDTGERVPVGVPISDTSAVILDLNNNVCAPGTVGDLYIRTPYGSHGYFNREGRIRDGFVQNPLVAEPDLVFPTGDLAIVRDDGLFEIVGRRDDMVKFRGRKVQLSLIEAAFRSLRFVEDVAVVLQTNDCNLEYIAAFVVTTTAIAPTEIRRELLGVLPVYMVPQEIDRVEYIPRTAHGKLDKQALPIAQMPKIANESGGALLACVVKVYSEALPFAKGIRDDDAFQDLGGQSLEAARIVGRLNRDFGIGLTLSELFELGSPSAVSNRVASVVSSSLTDTDWVALLGSKRDALKVGTDATNRCDVVLRFDADQLRATLDRVRDKGHNVTPYTADIVPEMGSRFAPLSFAQTRFWTLEQRQAGDLSLVYTWAARVKGVCDLGALTSAITAAANEHPASMIEFSRGHSVVLQRHGTPRQVIASVEHYTARGDEDHAGLHSYLRRLAGRSFRLGDEALLRAHVIRLAPDSLVVLFVGHVIVSDGWTKALFLRSVSRLYNRREPPKCLAQHLSFLDFARWELKALPFHNQQSLNYWKAALPVRLPSFSILYDRPPQYGLTTGDNIMFTLPEEHLSHLMNVASACGQTPSATLLAALLVSLRRLTCTESVTLVIPTANRPREEFEKIMGCFADSFLFSCACDWRASFAEWVRTVGRQLIEAAQHSVIAFEPLMDALFPQTDKYDPTVLPVMFSPQLPLDSDLSLDGLDVEELPVDLDAAIFHLHVYTFLRPKRLDVRLNFNTAVFDRARIEMFGQLFVETIGECVHFPDKPLSYFRPQPSGRQCSD